MMFIEKMQEHVVEWIELLIPERDRDPMATCIKLSEEVNELVYEHYTGGDGIGEEVADCLILLLDIAYMNDVDITEEFLKKMAINRNRKWKTKNGSMKHEDSN